MSRVPQPSPPRIDSFIATDQQLRTFPELSTSSSPTGDRYRTRRPGEAREMKIFLQTQPQVNRYIWVNFGPCYSLIYPDFFTDFVDLRSKRGDVVGVLDRDNKTR